MTGRFRESPALTIGMLSTYPPTLCGLATFSSALERALREHGHRVDIVRVDDGSSSMPVGPRVAGVLTHGSRESRERAAATLSRCDVAVIQHEYGIFGGPDGEEVIDVMRSIEVPTIVVLHTVPRRCSVHQQELLVELCESAARVIVMSESAHERLVEQYFDDSEGKVVTIPHGAALARHVLDGTEPDRNSKAQLLTWGLLGPGKGIEHVIEALGLLHARGRAITYTIAGATHPKVLAREGNAYRNRLRARAAELGIAHLVTFDDQYRGVAELTEFIAAAGVVVLPYDNDEQVTSGVLVDSIAAGRPVISTRFPHAVEMLSSGAGRLVQQRDDVSMARAIDAVTGQPKLRRSMSSESCALAPLLSWQAVAADYVSQARLLVASRQRLSA